MVSLESIFGYDNVFRTSAITVKKIASYTIANTTKRLGDGLGKTGTIARRAGEKVWKKKLPIGLVAIGLLTNAVGISEVLNTRTQLAQGAEDRAALWLENSDLKMQIDESNQEKEKTEQRLDQSESRTAALERLSQQIAQDLVDSNFRSCLLVGVLGIDTKKQSEEEIESVVTLTKWQCSVKAQAEIKRYQDALRGVPRPTQAPTPTKRFY